MTERGDMTHSYIAVDLETTGLDPKRDKIMEIGALKVKDCRIIEEYSALIHPRRHLDHKITELTGITDQMLAGAHGIEEVISSFLEFCGDLPLLGHHVIFDYSFIKRAACNHGFEFERCGIDTLRLCRMFMPEEKKKNLADACAFYGISNPSAHRALSDARAAHNLYEVLYERHGSRHSDAFLEKPLIYKVKKEQPATKRQKERLRDLLKYHKISLTVQIDYLSRNEISRIMDKIISQYGRI